MTTITTNFRGFAIAALLTVGIVTTLATGGGSGDGMGPTPPSGGPTLALTAANAPTVSSTLIAAIGAAFDIGDITGSGIPIQAGGMLLSIATPKAMGDSLVELAVAEAPDISECVNGGTVDVTVTTADPNTVTVGDRFIAVFDNCDDNEGYVITGTADLTVSAYEGDVLTEVFLLGFEVTLSDVVIDDGVESVTANASFTLTLDYLDFPRSRLNLAGSQLQLSAGGEVTTLTNFDHDLESEWVQGFIWRFIAAASGTMEMQSIGGTIDYSTPVTIVAYDEFDPETGEILITGADSTIRIIIVDNANVTLEIDVNGDGVVDEYVYTNWSELNGNT